jgi:copper chaperone CopZ
MHTTLRIEGANCSFCFNEAVDELQRTKGVTAVVGSIAGPCIDITHDAAIDAETLTAVVRNHVRAVEMFANEVRMVPLEPSAAPCSCSHT